MEERIEIILDQYYKSQRPVIADVKILDESLDSGIICIRWREEDTVITVKSIFTENEIIITQLT